MRLDECEQNDRADVAISASRMPSTLSAGDQPPAELSDQKVSELTGAVQPDCTADCGGCRRASAGTACGGFLRRTGRTDPVVNQNSMNTTS